MSAWRPVRVGVRARGDLPDQRAALGGGQVRSGGLGDHRPPVQRDLLSQLVIHAWCLLHAGNSGTGGMKRRLPTTSQGETVLAAISLPPVTADANRHASRPAHPGSPHAAANAAPTASAANRAAPAGGGIPGPPRPTAPPPAAVPRTP